MGRPKSSIIHPVSVKSSNSIWKRRLENFILFSGSAVDDFHIFKIQPSLIFRQEEFQWRLNNRRDRPSEDTINCLRFFSPKNILKNGHFSLILQGVKLPFFHHRQQFFIVIKILMGFVSRQRDAGLPFGWPFRSGNPKAEQEQGRQSSLGT